MTDLEQKLIDAIKAGNVDETMQYIVENICGSQRVAMAVVDMALNDTLKMQDPAIQAIGHMAIKFGQLAIEYDAARRGS